jgi:hypothetical protein
LESEKKKSHDKMGNLFDKRTKRGGSLISFFTLLNIFYMEPLTKSNEKDELSDTGRLSTCSSPSSSYKMSVDSDDARSISSMSCKSSIKPYSWTEKQKDEVLFLDDYRPTTKKSPKSSYDFRERPERRSVNRRSSLLVSQKIGDCLAYYIFTFYIL